MAKLLIEVSERYGKNWKMWIIAIVVLVGAFLFAHIVTPNKMPWLGN
jgi:hypothetical protein